MGCQPNNLISVFQGSGKWLPLNFDGVIKEVSSFSWPSPALQQSLPQSMPILQPCQCLSRTGCRGDWLVLMLSCTQKGQRRREFLCPCQHSMYLAVRPGSGWRAGFGTVLSLPYKVWEEKFVCEIMFCVNYFACTMMVDLWIGNCT